MKFWGKKILQFHSKNDWPRYESKTRGRKEILLPSGIWGSYVGWGRPRMESFISDVLKRVLWDSILLSLFYFCCEIKLLFFFDGYKI